MRKSIAASNWPAVAQAHTQILNVEGEIAGLCYNWQCKMLQDATKCYKHIGLLDSQPKGKEMVTHRGIPSGIAATARVTDTKIM